MVGYMRVGNSGWYYYQRESSASREVDRVAHCEMRVNMTAPEPWKDDMLEDGRTLVRSLDPLTSRSNV